MKETCQHPARFDGYRSLALTILILTVDFWGPLVFAFVPPWLAVAVWPGAFLFACLFGFRGLRSHFEGSRFAAIVSSTVILVFIATVFLSRR